MPDAAIAAPNDAAADAGEQIVRAGGNAVDAAVAAVLVTMVNEVGIVSLSSGCFVTVQPPDAAPYTVDGWMDMPGRGREVGGGTWDVTTAYGGGVDITIGPGSVAVHGSTPALGEAHRRHGRLPWRELVAPALDVARGGFRLGAASRYYLDHVHDDIYGWDHVSRDVLHGPDGELTTGRVVVPGLLDAFAELADGGPTTLHTGELGRQIADDVTARGGVLTIEDLLAYRPVVRSSLTTRLGEWTLSTTPPPSVGGVVVAAMLRLMDGHPRHDWDAADVRRLVDVERAVLGHRHHELDHSTDLERDARAFLDRVDRDHLGVLESGSTVHISVTDSDGLACALTASSGYGAGMIAEGTGIWLNNCLGEQELNPQGLHRLPPGHRLLSNMAPTVGRHTDGRVLAIGSPGADRITTAITQVLAGFANGDLSLHEAVRHPRVHVHRAGSDAEQVKVESELSMYFGGVAATLADRDGHLEAAADPRRDGAVRLVRP